MKFRIRKPSLKKRIAARTSLKRVVRHNLGFKAPRGWGWLTNPKKAAYNRVYSRTTIDMTKLFSGSSTKRGRAPQSSGGEGGCLMVFLACALGFAAIVAFAANAAAAGVFFLLILTGLLYANVRAASAAKRAEEQAVAARFADLSARFGSEAAADIMDGRCWQGGTVETVVEAFGQPEDVKEKVYKTKTKTTYFYRQIAKNRFALKVHFENGIVVGWDE